MNFPRLATTVLLSVAIGATAACGTQQAGSPVPAVTAITSTVVSTSVATVTATAADTATATTVRPTATVPNTTHANTTHASTTGASTTAAPTSSPTSRTTTRSSATRTSATVDAVTQRWILGMCTDMHGVLVAVFDVPHSDENATLAQYRQDYVDYYDQLSTAAQQALDDARNGLPPTVPNGPAIHQRFITYLTGLQDVASSGAAVIAKETSAADISADITEISKEMEDLGNGDAGLGDLSSPELKAAIAAAPECKDLTG